MIGVVSRARATLTALTLIPTLLVAGCSDDDPEPKVDPPSSEAPSSVSPSPTATAPTMPPAAKGTDAAAAEAFVAFYWDTVNYAQASGDVAPLKVLADQCKGCDSGVAFIEAAYADGGEIRGGGGTVSRLKTVFINREGENWAIVECRVRSTEQVVDRPGSGNDERYPGGSADLRIYLQPTTDSWAVRSLAPQ
jgi:hypothetical protein